MIAARTVEEDAECGSSVYFVQCGQYVKIGIADNPKTRLRELQVGNPITLTILNTFKVVRANQVEHSLHEHFMDQWQRGEWFTMPADQIERIRNAKTLLEVM